MNPGNNGISNDVLVIIQDKLRSVMGKQFVITLFASEKTNAATHYHLRIDHEPTGMSLEHHDKVEDGFIEDIFTVATLMKSMIDRHEAAARMGDTGRVKLLTWISDEINPTLLQASEQAQRICLRALHPGGRPALATSSALHALNREYDAP